jgi:hypothetical protein
MTQALWTLRGERRAEDDELVFVSESGRLIDQSNPASRVLKPAAVRRVGALEREAARSLRSRRVHRPIATMRV